MGETMATRSTDFEESMITELTNFIRNQACVLSITDLDRLVSDLPTLRERFARISSEFYPYLSDQLQFLSLFVEEQVVGRSRDLAEEPVAEAAFALLYFQRATDLIPDPIPGMGLLDDAMIVSIVLRRQEHAFKRSLHGHMLRWPEPKFDVDQLLSVISPLRVTSFCSPSARQPRLQIPGRATGDKHRR
jgi:uncharacterized membrane protein YkvA (DUF1232 family)